MNLLIDARSPFSFQKLFSISLIERILRQIHEIGIPSKIGILIEPNRKLESALRSEFARRFPVKYTCIGSDEPLELHVERFADEAPLILLEGDGIYDERILKTLMTHTGSLSVVNQGDSDAPLALRIEKSDRDRIIQKGPIPHLLNGGSSGITVQSIEDMSAYVVDLRRQVVPILRRMNGSTGARAIENRMYEDTFKGVMDFIATYVYRIPVRGLVRLLAPTRISPNMITAASVLCSFLPIPLFATGWIWTGLIVAFAFIIFDSLDGKLARLTVRLSKTAGNIDSKTSTPFESMFYLAWGWYFSGGDLASLPARLAILIVLVYYLDKLTTGSFAYFFRRSLFDYKKWDARFHLIAGRRTVNLAILTIGYAFGKPIAGMAAVAGWLCVTFAWHASRFGWHYIKKISKNENLKTA